MSFGKEKAWLGAVISAFSVGCGEPSDQQDVGDRRIKDKEAEIEKAPVGQDEVVDDELVVRGGDMGHDTEDIVTSGEIKIENKTKTKIETKIEKEFRNVLMEEADGNKPGDWMGDKYEDEVKRLKEKLPRELSKNKFDNSLLQLHKFFVPRKDEAKNDVVGLLNAVKDGKETRFFVNKEYRDNVKKFAEKYGAQYGVPVEIIYGVMAVENAGKHDPRKNAADGAYGIMQVQPGVVDHLQEMKFNGENWKGVSVADLEGNIRAGTAYLAYLYERYASWSDAERAYNAGPAAFERDLMSAKEGSLEYRAGLKGGIRDLKKEIKKLEKENEDENDEKKEAIILDLKEKLKIRQGDLSAMNEHLDQVRAGMAKKKGGLKEYVRNRNFWMACSRNGEGGCVFSNADYPGSAMYLSKSMCEIMQSDGGEVKLTPLTDEMK